MAYPFKDPSRSWKLNATSYNAYRREQDNNADRKEKADFRIFIAVITLGLLFIFG